MEFTLVTGAAGFIAFHFIESLLRSGQAVIGVDNLDPFYSVDVKRRNVQDLQRLAKELNVPFVFEERDVRSLSVSSLGNRKINAVIHLAAKAGVRPSLQQPSDYLSTNIDGTLSVLQLCRQAGVTQFVFGSSSSVYGNDTRPPFREDSVADRPLSPYAASKRAAELLCYTYAHLYQLKIAVLRFFTVYGPRQRPDLAIHSFAQKIYRREPITLFGDGSSARDYTYVTDTVAGIRSALKWVSDARPGTLEAFNLGSAHPITLLDLVSLIETSLQIRAERRPAPMQPGDVERTCADLTKGGRILGYQPKITIEQGIPLFAHWFLEEAARHTAKAA